MFEDLGLGVVGDGLVEFGDELGKEDVAAGFALVDGVGEKAGGQAGFADAGGTQPNDVLILGEVAGAVVKGLDGLFVELGLAVKRKGLQHPGFGNAGPAQTLQAGVLTTLAVFVLDHMGQETGMGEAVLGGVFKIIVPLGQQTRQTQRFELVGEFFIHGSREWEVLDFLVAEFGRWKDRVGRSGHPVDRLHVVQRLGRSRA